MIKGLSNLKKSKLLFKGITIPLCKNFNESITLESNTQELFLDKTIEMALDNDPQNPKLKRILKVLNAIKKEFRYETKDNKEMFIPRMETLKYLEFHNFEWIEQPSDPFVKLLKRTKHYDIEIKLMTISRDKEELKRSYRISPDDFDERYFFKTEGKYLLPLEKASIREELALLRRKEHNPLGLDIDAMQMKYPIEILLIDSQLNQKLFFLVSLIHGEIHIEKVRLFDKESFDLSGYQLHFGNRDYTGPEFKYLSENLQKHFLNLIKSLGINTDLFFHIEYLAHNREQRLYLEWLQNLYNFCKFND